MDQIQELKLMISNAIPSGGDGLNTDINTEEKLLDWLSARIDHLIAHDFEGLLFLLYRIDVSENKIKEMLAKTKGENAARTIATLILERQLQKLKLRKEMGKYPATTDDPERW